LALYLFLTYQTRQAICLLSPYFHHLALEGVHIVFKQDLRQFNKGFITQMRAHNF